MMNPAVNRIVQMVKLTGKLAVKMKVYSFESPDRLQMTRAIRLAHVESRKILAGKNPAVIGLECCQDHKLTATKLRCDLYGLFKIFNRRHPALVGPVFPDLGDCITCNFHEIFKMLCPANIAKMSKPPSVRAGYSTPSRDATGTVRAHFHKLLKVFAVSMSGLQTKKRGCTIPPSTHRLRRGLYE